jgi:tRNA threonylcarbamoyladenosine biosynthesis protein TsaE
MTSQLQITTHSLEETQLLGEKTGKLLEGGTVITLTGDLGSGKTSFVQGLAKGLDVPEDYYITSPTYTIINEYPGRCILFHVDLYRIGDSADLEDIGFYEILHGNGVVAIEWPNKLHDFLPDHLAIHIKVLNDEAREFRITGYGLKANNLINKLKFL